MKAFALNLLIATIWLLLSQSPSPAVFALGFLAGFLLLAAFKSVVGAEDYIRRWVGLVRFILLFTREFITANLNVAWTVLFRPPTTLRPGFVTYDVSGLSRTEILILSYCLTLTPGTTTVDISPDFKTLVFHALDAQEPEQLRAQLDNKLKPALLAFTR
ncbi:MAG: Na+/H+ antiporter subunit E [Verrucomicrobiae bacterium]|nr:Na+/H+ antiporter subunit E [Verrucomicrobiae bacterium]